MAETGHPQTDAHGAKGEGGHDAAEQPNPMHHILDVVLFGIDAQGRVVRSPYVHGKAVEGYSPKIVGPFRLEYTRAMLDVTVVAVLLAATLIVVARRVLRNVRSDEAPRGALANAVEALLCFVRDEIVTPIGGHHLAHFTPLFLTYFFFILFGNLSGMVPILFKGPTANISVTAALGGSVFLILTAVGIVKQGPVHYLLGMVPPGTPWWMWPLMFVLEFAGPVIKCFVLCVRLFANMIAGHLVLSNILSLGVFKAGATGMAVMGLALGIPLALGVSFLEVLVCMIQAYVFTMLSVIFVGAAVHPEH